MERGTEGSAGSSSLSPRSGGIGNCAGSRYPSELEPPLAAGARFNTWAALAIALGEPDELK
jgi:hypothetical protein